MTEAESRAVHPPQLSVVVLAYNEAANLVGAISEIVDVLGRVQVTYEVVIVNDGSTDETGRLADQLAAQFVGLRVVHHATNLGLGGGYRTGFCVAAGNYLTFFPADRQFPADIIADFLPRMHDVDLVLGYLPSRHDSWVGKGLSAAERALYAVLFGRMPRFQGIFMARRAMLVGIPLRSMGRGWAVLMEFIIRADRAGWRIESVPTEVRPRASGQSKVNNLRTIASNLAQVVALRRLI